MLDWFILKVISPDVTKLYELVPIAVFNIAVLLKFFRGFAYAVMCCDKFFWEVLFFASLTFLARTPPGPRPCIRVI